MNQHFNFRRLLNYANYNLRINKKLWLLIIGGFSMALYFLEIFMFTANKGWRNDSWTVFFSMIFAVSGLLIVGHSFHFLRKKETSINVLLLPVSTFEKYIYELVTKIILFSILFLVLFPAISALAANTMKFVFGFPGIDNFKYSALQLPNQKYLFELLILGGITCFSLAFAGAAALIRFPLLKTLLFAGTLFGVVISYIYFIFEKLNLDNGVEYVIQKFIKDGDQAMIWLFSMLIISTLTFLTYAFFKLKEREV